MEPLEDLKKYPYKYRYLISYMQYRKLQWAIVNTDTEMTRTFYGMRHPCKCCGRRVAIESIYKIPEGKSWWEGEKIR